MHICLHVCVSICLPGVFRHSRMAVNHNHNSVPMISLSIYTISLVPTAPSKAALALTVKPA